MSGNKALSGESHSDAKNKTRSQRRGTQKKEEGWGGGRVIKDVAAPMHHANIRSALGARIEPYILRLYRPLRCVSNLLSAHINPTSLHAPSK